MNATKISNWVTEKGAKVEMYTKHITSESHTTDWGEVITKDADLIIIEKVIINEEVFNSQIVRTTKNDVRYLDLGNFVIDGKKVNDLVPLPQKIEDDVWGEYEARQTAKYNARKEREIKRDTEMKAKIKSGYCPKCGSYCYGDCTAN